MQVPAKTQDPEKALQEGSHGQGRHLEKLARIRESVSQVIVGKTDEINRATPRTQSSLLEAMEERRLKEVVQPEMDAPSGSACEPSASPGSCICQSGKYGCVRPGIPEGYLFHASLPADYQDAFLYRDEAGVLYVQGSGTGRKNPVFSGTICKKAASGCFAIRISQAHFPGFCRNFLPGAFRRIPVEEKAFRRSLFLPGNPGLPAI